MKGHYSEVWQRIAAAHPDRPAIVTPDETVSYGRFAAEAGALADRLRRLGLRPGDAVAVLLYNRPEYLVTLFACFASAFAPVTLNYRYRAGEIRALLEDSDARVMVVPSSLRAVAREAVAGMPHPPVLIIVRDTDAADGQGQPDAGALAWEEVVAHPRPLPDTPPDGAELRLYTGGTTGRPKAVVWAAEDILPMQLYPIYGMVGIPLPDSMADVVRIALDPATPVVRTLPLAPFLHGTALFNSMNALVLGGAVLVLPAARFDADAAVRFAIEAGATRLIVAGDAIALPLVEALERQGVSGFGAVASVISSGMRFSAQTKRRLHERAALTITDLVASTEGGPYAVNITTSAAEVPGELTLLPGAVVLDEQYNEVQGVVGGEGVLAFRGTLPRGYFRDEVKTRATFPVINGVRHVMPGDWAIARGDGTIELLGRGSAVVNTGGEKVYPAEVEEQLLAFPGIIDAVVFGMPDARYGEVVTAVIVVAGDGSLDADALRSHLDAHLAGYKKPRHLVIRGSLERSPHGKVDLPRLKAGLEALVGDADAPTGTMRVVR